jgi:polyphosphate kinase 2 (PPK2 family)
MDERETCRLEPGTRLRWHWIDPNDHGPFSRKEDALEAMAESLAHLDPLQDRLHAEGTRSLLIVLQALDAGGKDGTLRHLMKGVNPQGCKVTAFKAPTPEELAHDFLWRVHARVPARGEIGIFNRSQGLHRAGDRDVVKRPAERPCGASEHPDHAGLRGDPTGPSIGGFGSTVGHPGGCRPAPR